MPAKIYRTSMVCRVCHQEKPVEQFKQWARVGSVSRQLLCKNCDRLARIAYREKHPGQEALRRKRYRELHEDHRIVDPLKDGARRLTKAAISKGALVRPSLCSDCGKTGRIHAHHHDYTKPLEVEWLCQRCHGIRHRKDSLTAPRTPK